MARSLGTLTVDLLLKAGAWESDIGRAARIADKEAKSIARSFDAAGKAIGLALAAGVTTVVASVGMAINRMDDLSKAAQRANMPTEQFSALAHAADLADVSMQDLQGAMGKLAKAQGEALSSSSAQAKMFDKLGISVKNADGSLRNTADVFLDFSDKFQQFKGSPEIMAAGMQLFGRSFQNMIPLLKDGSAGLRSAMEEAKALGLVLSAEAGANAEQFNDNLSRLKSMAGGLGMALASELLPRLVAFTDNMVEMVKAAGGAEGVLKKLSGAFDTFVTVVKVAGVYIGTTYAASLVIATVRTLAMITSTTALSAAIGRMVMGLGALRLASALLFGPVGLIAAGATVLYMLATRQTEAEKAADLHTEALNRLKVAAHGSTEALANQAAQTKRNALAELGVARAMLEVEQSKAKARRERVKSTLGEGRFIHTGKASVALDETELRESQAMVSQYQKQLNEIDAQLVKISVDSAFEPAPYSPKLNLDDPTVNKAKEAADTQAKYREELARTRAELAGPYAAAQQKEAAYMADLDAALKKHNIDIATYNGLKTESERRLAAVADKLAKEQDILGHIRGDYAEQLRLGGLSSEVRRVEEELIRRKTDAERAGLSVTDKKLAAWRDEIAAGESAMALQGEQSRMAKKYAEQMKRQAEDIENIFVGAATSATRAFGDFFARGLKGGKDFAKSLKDIFKRMLSDVVTMTLDNAFVRPFQSWLQGMFSGAGQMQQQGGTSAVGNTGMDKLTSYFGKLFGRGGAAQSAISAGTSSGLGTWTGSLVAPGSMQAQVLAGMPAGQSAGAASFGGVSPWMGGVAGAAYGWSQGGDTAGKIGGAVAGGVAGYGLAVGGAAAMGASAAGAGLGASAAAGMAAIPVIGWIALAAFAVNAISGGKLFGTKYKTDSAAQQFSIGEDGASGFTSVSESGQKSFFRGKKYRTTTTALDAEGKKAIQELFDALSKTVTQASQALGVDIPDLVGGTFRREFDAKGNLTKEFGTIAGRVYAEGQEAFASRLVGENLLNVAKQAGSAAELETLANAYRSTGEELQAFATLALAVQSDLKNANGIWKQAGGDDVMTRIVGYIEGIAKAGENMAETYARVSQTIAQYGDLVGSVRQQIATRGLNQYQKAQLDVELAYRAQVKQANELAKALGMTGARSEDLASIEQLRALNMADLATQYAAQQKAQTQTWLEDLGLSDLSPIRDDQKLTNVLGLLKTSSAAGDVQRSQKLAEQALSIGRNLFASGLDYSALYSQVTGLVGDIQPETMESLIGMTNAELATLADLMEGLPSKIAQELSAVLLVESPTPVAPTPTQPMSPSSGDNYSGPSAPTAPNLDILVDGIRRVADNTAELLQLQRSDSLATLNR